MKKYLIIITITIITITIIIMTTGASMGADITSSEPMMIDNSDCFHSFTLLHKPPV